jgi:hypothetical protein
MDLPTYVEAPPERQKPGLPKSNEGLFSIRRLVLAAVLVIGVAFAVYAFSRSPSQSVTAPATDPAVEQYLPSKPGTHVLQQAEVGVILKPGYDGRITINGTTIPEEQMDGVIPRDAPTYNPSLGLRPNNKNFVAFTPGPGKVFTKLPANAVEVSVTFWLVSRPSATRTITWQLSTA